MSNNTSGVKKLAVQIESLARQVQSSLDNGGDFLSPANELVRNSITFVFALGESYALDTLGTATAKPVKATVTKKGNANYHNLRDNRGRFASKV